MWVWRGLGELPGVINAANGLATSVIDISVYPDLIVAYLPITLSPLARYLGKVGILALVTVINILGLEVVSVVSGVLVFISMGVFVVEVPYAIAVWDASKWTSVPTPIDWALLFSILLWANTGYDSLGNFAGEVERPTRTYPRAIALTLVANSFAYIGPIVVGYTLLPDVKLWDDRGFLEAAEKTTFCIAIWMTVAASLSNVGKLNVGIATTVRNRSECARLRRRAQRDSFRHG